jgi:hypothetical protein
MGRMARKLKIRTRDLSIAFFVFVAPVLNAQAQIASPGNESTSSASNSWSQQPGERAPWLTYGIDAGVGESDNVTLLPTDKISQTIAVTDLDFLVKEQSRLLDANATGNFSYLDYLQNAYGSQLIGRFDGQAKLAIIPGRLVWIAQDDFGQAAVDPFTAVTPTNLENINYFTTGPELTLRPGGVNFIDLSAHYSRAQYQTTGSFNSNRGLASVSLGRDVSAGASVSLNAQFERVMFDDTSVSTDFDRTTASGRYELHGARTDFEADLGATKISQGIESTTGPLAELKLSRQVSPSAKLTATVGRELTDISSSFSTLQSATAGPGPSGVIGTAPAPQSAENYTSDYAAVGWQFQRNRTSIGLDARWEKDTYPAAPQLDLHHPSADFSVERRLTRAFSAKLFGRWSGTSYPNALVATSTASSKYDDWLLGSDLSWRYGRGLELRLRYSHTSHVVSTGDSGYGENRVFLTVGYRPRSTLDGE